MSRYLLGVNHARQRKFLKRSWKFVTVLIVLIVLGTAALVIDSVLQQRKATTPSQATKPVSSSIEPSIQVFSSPFFQFQTPKDWHFIANESTATKFVYRRGTANLVTGDMTVYINSSPSDMQATRVLPISLKDDGVTIKASFVSDHCNKKLDKVIQQTQGEAPVTLQTVHFLCDVDGTIYTVIVGQENGTPVMNFHRPDGTNANYIIYLRDLQFKPEPDKFVDIMNTFQIR